MRSQAINGRSAPKCQIREYSRQFGSHPGNPGLNEIGRQRGLNPVLAVVLSLYTPSAYSIRTDAIGRVHWFAMPKSKHRHRQAIPTRPSPPPAIPPVGSAQLGYDPKGPTESVDIVSSKEGWSEFTLQDGTIIRCKAILLDAKRMVGQYNDVGDPIYAMQVVMANQARVPDNLKKKSQFVSTTAVQKRERPATAPLVQHLYRVFETISGSSDWTGAVMVHDVSAGMNLSQGTVAWSSTVNVGMSVGGVYYTDGSEYDPGFVAHILRADAAPVETTFDNVVDMLDWLERD
jgi:hypothetical protein